MATTPISKRRILVTGGNGFLGHHVVDVLKEKGSQQIFVGRSRDYDLTKEEDVRRIFKDAEPEIVFHLAGLVGGILANKERPADFFYQNLMMGTLMLHYSCAHGVKKFIAAGAGCGYPQNAPLPLREESFWDGYPQEESAPYSLAKRLMSVQAKAYERQHGFTSIICIPGNIYGPWDNFNLRDSHVIPALVRKFVEAKGRGLTKIEVWGSGRPTRDFVYVRDVAEGMVRAAEALERSELINLSSGTETSIADVCRHLKEITRYQGVIDWNRDRPEGQPRRGFDVSKSLKLLGFSCGTDIGTGLKKTVSWYEEYQESDQLRR